MPIIDCQTIVGVWPSSPVDLSPGALTSAMQARGVARAIACHTSAIFYDAPSGNRAVEAMAGLTPGLVPAAVLNPRRYPACLAEAKRALAAGVRCFRFFPGIHDYPFSGQLAALTETLDALRGAKMLQIDLQGAGAAHLARDFGPQLTMPTLLTVECEDLALALAAAKQIAYLRIDTSRLTATGAIDTAVRTLGADRVLFGSGAPLTALGSAIMSVQYAELSEAERAAVLEGNAAKILA